MVQKLACCLYTKCHFNFFLWYYVIGVCLFSSLSADHSPAKIRALYNSLDPSSISQHLAFYELYQNTYEGKKALDDAWVLLTHSSPSQGKRMPLLPSSIDTLIALVNKPSDQPTLSIPVEELAIVQQIGQSLKNRALKGHSVNSEEEVLKLKIEEIDLAHALLVSQLADSPERNLQMQSYEAMLDLMALQILTKISFDSPANIKIKAINNFVFDQMGFRFPPHSVYAKNIDLYTFLPSVLESRRGVCLGVSILYISLAQRLGLSLEIVTPPGHIYVRHREDKEVINIETTARGIHLPSEEYLGIETKELQIRTLKEVIGMAHYNHASVYWQQEDYEKALTAYQKALPYLANDMLLKELMAYNYLFVGKDKEGMDLLHEVKDHIPHFAVMRNSLPTDLIEGNVDTESIKPLFMAVDDRRESIVKKREALESSLKKFPRFKEGWSALASTWLQLHRQKESLEALEKYHSLEPNDPTTHYYMAALYVERWDYNNGWIHLNKAEAYLKKYDHNPKALKELRRKLSKLSPI